jgi:NAD(P)-dependent dehydrogenase (short-subunit alcohol dehydrogenase family)
MTSIRTDRSYDLRGKVVLITGGTGGIGSATARELIGRGAKVAIVDVDPQTPQIAARMSSHSAIGVIADVRSRDALDVAVTEVVDRFGRIDVAIANAGVLSRAATLRNTPISSIESVLAVNVSGVVNTVQSAMEEVIAHRGHFVLISSVFAFLNGMGTIPYAMSKAAVEQLGRGLRVELAAHGVSTTVAYFSLIETNMVKHGVDEDPVVEEILASLPRPLLKRLQPAAAATALADAIAHRSPRVMVPSRWKPISALRGLINPASDSRLTRDRRTTAALSRLDVRSPTAPSPQNRPIFLPERTIESKGTQ